MLGISVLSLVVLGFIASRLMSVVETETSVVAMEASGRDVKGKVSRLAKKRSLWRGCF